MGVGVLHLLKKKTFFPLFISQFFGAFNDNAFKLAMLTLISYFLSVSQAQSEHYQVIAGALFIFPFFLFSATAGQLADKYDKAKMARLIKLFEVVLMGIGGLAFYLGNIFLMMATLTGMGIHSTFFGPIKYAILPDHLPKDELLGATALIEGSTFLAILIGTTLGTLSVGGVGSASLYAIVITCSAAIVGLFAAYFIPPAPPTALDLHIDWRLWRATNRMFKDVIYKDHILSAILAISWFWLIGSVVLTKLPDYTNYILRADTGVFATFLALFSIGIAVGSIVINRLLKGQVSLRYVPHALLLLSLFASDLYWATPNTNAELPLQSFFEFFTQPAHFRIAIDLFLLAFCGGAFVVPLYTYLQVTSDGSVRARTIASNNIFNALFMVIGAILVMIFLYFHLPIIQVFLIFGLLNFCAAIVLWFVLKN